MEFFLIGLGFGAALYCGFRWQGSQRFVNALLQGFKLLKPPAQSLLKPRTVYEFIQGTKDDAKRGAYAALMGNMRKLLLDIYRHRAGYPADIDELKGFILSQLRYNLERSPVCGAAETGKFRDLAENFVLTETMQKIYMADCKASREAAAQRLNRREAL